MARCHGSGYAPWQRGAPWQWATVSLALVARVSVCCVVVFAVARERGRLVVEECY